uniref:Secreted protein n=1 Tax=Steinernema glaseri TaxID=37863 RepID=A0A1I7ZU16_9BILA
MRGRQFRSCRYAAVADAGDASVEVAEDVGRAGEDHVKGDAEQMTNLRFATLLSVLVDDLDCLADPSTNSVITVCEVLLI